LCPSLSAGATREAAGIPRRPNPSGIGPRRPPSPVSSRDQTDRIDQMERTDETDGTDQTDERDGMCQGRCFPLPMVPQANRSPSDWRVRRAAGSNTESQRFKAQIGLGRIPPLAVEELHLQRHADLYGLRPCRIDTLDPGIHLPPLLQLHHARAIGPVSTIALRHHERRGYSDAREGRQPTPPRHLHPLHVRTETTRTDRAWRDVPSPASLAPGPHELFLSQELPVRSVTEGPILHVPISFPGW